MPQIVNLADASANLVGHPNYMKKHLRAVRKTLSVHLPTVFTPDPQPAPTSVAEILADFEAKVKHLIAVKDSKLAAVNANKARIAALETESAAHALEATRAENVAGKLKALVS